MTLEQWIRKAGWTKAGLARELGVSRQALANWVAGVCSPQNALVRLRLEELSGGEIGARFWAQAGRRS